MSGFLPGAGGGGGGRAGLRRLPSCRAAALALCRAPPGGQWERDAGPAPEARAKPPSPQQWPALENE